MGPLIGYQRGQGWDGGLSGMIIMSLTELAPARERGVMCQRPWPLLVVGVCSGNIDLRLKQVLKPWRSGLESWSHVNDFPS